MDSERFDRVTRKISSRFTASTARRTLLQRACGLSAAAFGLDLVGFHGDAKGKKKKKCKDCCLSNGSHCKKASSKCKAKHCLNVPFTIEAHWINPDTDHDTFLFVPFDPDTALPSPYIDYGCGTVSTGAGGLYPFAFVSGDATGPGDEVTTIASLLDGKYEYWIELYGPSPVGDLTVTLRNPNGRILRSWSSPENPSMVVQRSWHVFDIQGSTRSIASIDALVGDFLPEGAHVPNTDVCP